MKSMLMAIMAVAVAVTFSARLLRAGEEGREEGRPRRCVRRREREKKRAASTPIRSVKEEERREEGQVIPFLWPG